MSFGALRRLAPVVGANAVPIAGVLTAGWSGATALSLYWCENLLGSLLVLARLLLHRRLTRKRGYTRLQLGLQTSTSTGPQRPRARRRTGPAPGPAGVRRRGSFVAEFAATACAATLVHGAALAFLLRGELGGAVQGAPLRQGLLGIAAFQLLGFLLDLPGLRERPFAWARQSAELAVNRVMLVHLVVIAGVWFAGTGGGGFFGPFAVLKGLADVGNALQRLGWSADGEEAPGWLAAAMNRLRRDGDFAAYWREERAAKRALEEEDERVDALG